MANIVHTIKLIADAKKAMDDIRSYQDQIVGTASTVKKYEATLNGDQILKAANNWTAAVARLGGATKDAASAEELLAGVAKLSTSEKEKVNKIVGEAIEKYRLLGQTAPSAMTAIAEATKKVEPPTSALSSRLSALAGLAGVSLSAGAFVAFGKSVFDSASKVHDLAEQIGISTDAVQGFKFAAEQSGSSLDAVGTAIQKMNKNLAEGDKGRDKGTVGALKDAGLSFQQIRNMKPEDAFLAIADGVQKIPDPMVQSQVALTLFGKSAGELLPAMKEGFRDAANGALKMSEDTIKSLEAAQDAWEQLGNDVTIVTGNMIAEMMKLPSTTKSAFSGITGSVAGFKNFVVNAWTGGIGSAVAWSSAVEQAAKSAAALPAAVSPIPSAIHKTKEELDAAAAAAKKWADQVDAAFRKFSGGDVAEQAKILDTVFRRLADSGHLTQRQMKDIVDEAVKLGKEGATLSPRLWELVKAMGALDPIVTEGADAFAKLGDKVDLAIPALSEFAQASTALQTKIKNAWDGVTDIGFKVSDGFKEGAKALSDAQKEIHDRLVGIGQELASAFSGGGGFVQGLKNLGTSVAKDFTAGLLSFIPGIGPLLSQLAGPLIDGIKHLFGGVFSTAGRDAVKQFADSMGGFDALHKTLLDSLQGVGEQFWVRLTQEVGRGDAKGAQAVIDEIQDALANAPLTGAQLAAQAGYQTQADLQAVADKAKEVYDYMVSSGQYSASQIADAFKKMQDAQLAAMDDTKRAAYDAATTARDAAQQVIDALDGQIKSLQQSIAQEAPEEVMGAIEAQQRAQLAALQEQRAAAQANLDSANDQIADAADAAVAAAAAAAMKAGEQTVNAIQDALDHHEFTIHGKLDGLPGGSTPGFGGAQADGGDYYVTKPTWFLAGEKPGGEYASFSGVGKPPREGGGSRGGTKVLQPVSFSIAGRQFLQAVIDVAHEEGAS